MTTDTVPQTVLFPDLFDKPLFAKFNQEQASSDGGAVLLKAAERVYGLVKAFARCLSDKRAPEKIRHTLADLIGGVTRRASVVPGAGSFLQARRDAVDSDRRIRIGRSSVLTAAMSPGATVENQGMVRNV